jgi:putative chitinase
LSKTINTPEARQFALAMPRATAVAQKQFFTQAEYEQAVREDLTRSLKGTGDQIVGAGTKLAQIGAYGPVYGSLAEKIKYLGTIEQGTFEEREAQAKKGQAVTDKATQSIVDANIQNRKARDTLQDLIHYGIVPVTTAMKTAAGATNSVTEAFESAAKKLGVVIKKRETPGAAEQAPARPAAPRPSQPAQPAQPRAVSRELATDLMSRLSASGVTDNRAQANILAQVDAESQGQSNKKENLNYSAERLLKVFPNKFKDLADAQAVVAQGQEAIGNKLYGGRMGNAENEGFLYRGRGLIQLTGKQNYEKFGKMLGVDLVKNPDLAADPEIAKQIAVAYFAEKQKSGVNLSDIKQIGKAVGYAGGNAETQKRAGLANNYLDYTKTAAPVTPKSARDTELPATSVTPKSARDTEQDRRNNASVDPRRTDLPTAQAEPVAPIPRANGGVIRAAPGGVNVLAAEAGKNEAFVPLPDGKSIPVQIASDEKQMGMMSAQLDRLDQLVTIMQNQLGVSQKLLKYAQ